MINSIIALIVLVFIIMTDVFGDKILKDEKKEK